MHFVPTRHATGENFKSDAVAVQELKQKKNGINPNILNCIQLPPSRAPSEYHLTFKSTKLLKNHN
eukprot:4189728-Ditylum_brightwellii.AAC.1